MRADLKPNQNKNVFEPIRSNEDIKNIRIYLSNRPRDLLLFDLATQTGIGMKKLLQLKIRHLMGVEVGGKFPIEPSAKKKYSIIMTDIVYDTFHRYLAEIRPKPDDYIFKSKKGQQPLNISSVSHMIKGWFETANIKGCYGSISLRKTWEYHIKNKANINAGPPEPRFKTVFDPVKTPTVQKAIFDKLLNAIISGKILPGTRLTTPELAETFSVSQAPVRVALNWLEAKGFIESQKKRGSIVKELSIKELREIIQIRIILETTAAKLSYKVCTEETFNLLESIIDSFNTVYTFEESDQLNKLFHKTLYRDADMPLLIEMIMDLYDRFSPYAALAFSKIDDKSKNIINKNHPQSNFYHIKILEGMRRKDLSQILKYLEMKLNRSTLYTEAGLKER